MRSVARCRWHRSPDVPGGRFLVPGCYSRAVYGDEAECHCPKTSDTDPLERLEARVAKLEKALAMQGDA